MVCLGQENSEEVDWQKEADTPEGDDWKVKETCLGAVSWGRWCQAEPGGGDLFLTEDGHCFTYIVWIQGKSTGNHVFPKKGAGGLIGFPYSQHRWWYKDETWEEDWKEDGTCSGMVRQGVYLSRIG